ncbi:MAG: metallophosphoesterase [Verrucomicrobiota bacterium]|nr:metallophosphoesterase [Verrucomicrobiota bacterium]
MKPLRIAQISDFHVTHLTWNPLRLFSKRILGNLNWVFHRRNRFSEEPLRALIPLLPKLELDWIFLGGDLTTTSLPEEFAKAKAIVNQFPAPCIAVPGNHDHYTYPAYYQKRFYRSFANPTPDSPFRLAEHGVEAHRLNSSYWLVALDTALATNLYSSRGLFSEQQEASLRQLLTSLPPNASILLLNHYPFFQNDVRRHSLKGGEKLEALIRKEPRIKAYLHGHSHRHTIADLQPSGLPLLLDSGSAADQEIGTWNLLTLDDEKIQIDLYRWNGQWRLSSSEQIFWQRKS